jgi:hypothetical protein
MRKRPPDDGRELVSQRDRRRRSSVAINLTYTRSSASPGGSAPAGGPGNSGSGARRSRDLEQPTHLRQLHLNGRTFPPEDGCGSQHRWDPTWEGAGRGRPPEREGYPHVGLLIRRHQPEHLHGDIACARLSNRTRALSRPRARVRFLGDPPARGPGSAIGSDQQGDFVTSWAPTTSSRERSRPGAP